MATQPTNEYTQRVAAQQQEREKPDFPALAQQFHTWTVTELEILWDRNDQIRNVADFKFFLYYTKQNHLDPILGEVVPSYRWDPIKRRETLIPIVTIGVLRKRRAEACDGLDEFKFTHEGAALVAASGTIYRKGCAHPFSSTIFYDEYVPTDRHGNISSIWAGKGHMLLSKCLEAQLTRLGFFDLCGDILIEEETLKRDREEPGPQKPPADEFTVGEKPEPTPDSGSLNENPQPEVKAAAPEPAKEPEPVKLPVPEPAPKPEPQPQPVAAPAEEPVFVATPEQIAKARSLFGPPDQPAPVQPPPQPAPPPAAITMTSRMAEPTFDEVLTYVSKVVGGEVKAAHLLITRYIAAFLGVGPKSVPKDRVKLLVPLKKLAEVITTNVDELRANPERLGNTLAGRTANPLEEELATLKWSPALQGLARQVMQVHGFSEENFLKWIHIDVAGTGANAFSVARMDPAALEILLPLYILVKERAFEVVDWALAHNEPITKTLTEMVACTNKPIAEWDATFAGRILTAIGDAGKAPASQNERPAPPPADDLDSWSSAGLPFEM